MLITALRISHLSLMQRVPIQATPAEVEAPLEEIEGCAAGRLTLSAWNPQGTNGRSVEGEA